MFKYGDRLWLRLWKHRAPHPKLRGHWVEQVVRLVSISLNDTHHPFMVISSLHPARTPPPKLRRLGPLTKSTLTRVTATKSKGRPPATPARHETEEDDESTDVEWAALRSEESRKKSWNEGFERALRRRVNKETLNGNVGEDSDSEMYGPKMAPGDGNAEHDGNEELKESLENGDGNAEHDGNVELSQESLENADGNAEHDGNVELSQESLENGDGNAEHDGNVELSQESLENGDGNAEHDGNVELSQESLVNGDGNVELSQEFLVNGDGNAEHDGNVEVQESPVHGPEMAGGDGSAELAAPPVKTRQSTEDRKRVHREACRRWHQKYVKKGVLREPKAADDGPRTEPVAASAKAAAVGKSKARKAKKATEKPVNAVEQALAAEGLPPLPSNDFRKAKAAYVKFMVQKIAEDEKDIELGPKERYLKALARWMESPVRAALFAARQGKQLIPSLH